MTNATKIYLGNWSKAVVVTGGTGNLTLGEVTGYPSIAETIGTLKSFHYVIRAVNNAPLESGVGYLTDSVTLRRDNVLNKIDEDEYISGDDLSKLNIPAGALVYTADTKEMLEDLVLELPAITYTWNGTDDSREIDIRHQHISLEVGGDLTTITFDEDSIPPAGVKHSFTLALHALEYDGGVQSKVRFAGANFHFGNGVPIPDYPVFETKTVEILPIGLVNGSTYKAIKAVREIVSLVGDDDTPLVLGTNYSFNAATNTITIISIGSITQPYVLTYSSNSETVLKFETWDGGENYKVTNQTEDMLINDLGVWDDLVTVDLRHKLNKAVLQGTDTSVTINAISPSVELNQPARFYVLNESGDTKNLYVNSGIIAIDNSTFNYLQIPALSFAVLDIQRNPLNDTLSYLMKVGDINYNISGSGLTTTLNPSDKNAGLLLTADNKTFSTNAFPTSWVYYTGRCFGGKSTGKWQFSARVDVAPASPGASREAILSIGVSDATQSLSAQLGAVANAAAIRMYAASSGAVCQNIRNNVAAAFSPSVTYPSAGAILRVLIDIDTGKVWFAVNADVCGGGNPNAGTGQTFTLTPNAIYWFAACLAGIDNSSGEPTRGVGTVQNELDPYKNLWPDFNWATA